MFISKLKGKFKRGIRIPFLDLRIRVERDESLRHDVSHRVVLGHIRKLMERVPELEAFYHPCIESNRDYCQDFLGFLDDYIPLIRDSSREVQKRRLLYRIRRSIKEPDFREKIDYRLLLSNVRAGIADDRAWGFLDEKNGSPEDQELIRNLREAIREHEKYYEAKVPYFQFMYDIRNEVYAHRERSLIFYFQNNRELIRGKRILHFAPERGLSKWFRMAQAELGIEYVTADPFLKGVDRREDLSALSFADNYADLVICHHIIDLILDDLKAMREVLRVLRPGGLLQASEPESMQNATANEWLIHDLSLHNYIRQYGRDFAQRLASAGFEVNVERTFLDMTREEHQRRGTMPIRLYHCRKPEGRGEGRNL